MYWTQLENADYFMDMETSIRDRKRRRGEASHGHVYNSDRYDEDIVLFLEGLEEFWALKFKGDDEDDDDPSYMAFLENLKEHGNAYICDVSVEHGVLFPIVYEEEDDDSAPVKSKIRGGTCSRKKKKVSDERRSNRDEHRRSFEVVGGLNNSNARNGHFDGVKGKTPISGRGDCSSEDRSLPVDGDQRSGPVSSGEQVSQEVDPVYKEFLDNIYVVDGCVFFDDGKNKRIFFESDDLQTDIRSSASTRRPPKKTPKSRPPSSTLEPSTSVPRPTTPPSREQVTTQRRATTTNNDMLNTSTCNNVENPHERYSSFWKELHEYLRKPYKQEEYDDLMLLVSVQKPMSTHRDSRSGGSERHGQLGKSYLQHYPDLNLEIKRVESDSYKVLNLLRMFEVYVQKIPSGVPKPWLDDFSKTIMPGSK